jgi:hypothetical protein
MEQSVAIDTDRYMMSISTNEKTAIIMKAKKSEKTAHEKKVELANASAPSYGIYMDGGSVDKLAEAIALIGPVIQVVLDSESEEKTKRLALAIIEKSVPSIENVHISNVDINLKKNPV